MRSLAAAVLVLTFLPAALGQEAKVGTSRESAPPPLPTQQELAGLLHAFDVPGLAMATLSNCEVDGKVTVAGQATLNPGTAVTQVTAFEAALLSKPVFAWLVLQLAG